MSQYQAIDFQTLFQGVHTTIIAKTGAGKTTLLKSIFLSMKNKGQMVVHFRPDPERIVLYKQLKIPIYRTKEEVLLAYFRNSSSHIVWDADPKILTGIDPYVELMECMNLILKVKALAEREGLYSTIPIYFLIDEAQNMMSAYSMGDELQENITEGRKYKLFLITVSQRLALLHQTSKTQSSIVVGYQSMEHRYLRDYDLKSPKEFYTFYVVNDMLSS